MFPYLESTYLADKIILSKEIINKKNESIENVRRSSNKYKIP